MKSLIVVGNSKKFRQRKIVTDFHKFVVLNESSENVGKGKKFFHDKLSVDEKLIAIKLLVKIK